MVRDTEPRPKLPPSTVKRVSARSSGLIPLPPPRPAPDADFAVVLERRKSAISGPVSDQQLGDLLFEVMKPRRGGPGRFGIPWEGRASPSAGGLHVISILCIPVDPSRSVGFYDPTRHALGQIDDPHLLQTKNAEEVHTLCSARAGTTLQFMADAQLLASCYDNSETLLWRDSGAVAATLCMAATAFGLTSVILGRTGAALTADINAGIGLIAAGAVHIGSYSVQGEASK